MPTFPLNLNFSKLIGKIFYQVHLKLWIIHINPINMLKTALQRFSVECRNFLTFAWVLLCYALCLVKKTHATFLTNEKPNQTNRDLLACVSFFPALGAGCVCLLRMLIGSLRYLPFLWLVRVITSVWFYDTQLKTALIRTCCHLLKKNIYIYICQYSEPSTLISANIFRIEIPISDGSPFW